MIATKQLELRPVQEVIINDCRSTISRFKRMILMSATGVGKTIIAVWMIKQAIHKSLKILFICDRITLVNQTSLVFKDYGILHGVIMADHPDYAPDLQVQVASIQTLARRKIHEFDFIIIDEVHTWYKAHEKVLKMNPDAFVLGLSATPFSKGLGKHFDTHIEPVPVRQLINDGYLCDFEIYGPATIDLSNVKTVAGEYKKDDFSRKPNPGMILQAQQELNLDLGNSILIGDKVSDIQAGIAAGVGLNILFAQKQPSELSGLPYQAIATLREALPFMNSRRQQRVTS